MKKRIEDDQLELLLEEEMLKEAEAILAEVNNDKKLQEFSLPEDFDKEMEQKLLQYEKEREQYANLSDEDKEALRIGREMKLLKGLEELEVEEKTVAFRKKKSLKARLLVALVAVMVMGLGITAFGDTPFITKLIKHDVEDREVTIMETDKEDTSGEVQSDEWEVYQQMEEMFGSPVVNMVYIPDDSSFTNANIDEVLKMSTLRYDCENGFIEYKIYATYRNQSVGYDVEDELISEEELIVDGNNIRIKEYLVGSEKTTKYIATFENQGLQYILSSNVEKEEFEEIVKNLNFF